MQRICILICGIFISGFVGCLPDTEPTLDGDIMESILSDIEGPDGQSIMSQDSTMADDTDAGIADGSDTGETTSTDDDASNGADAEPDNPDVDGPVLCPDGCDDGKPCTVDSCVEGECVHTDDGSCEVKSCSGQNLSDAMAFFALEEGAPAKMALEVYTEIGWSCTEVACSDENPCCNTCDAQLYLIVPEQIGSPIPYDASETNMAWNCQTDDCGGSQSCQPVNAGHVYWIWGHVTYDPLESAESDENAEPAGDSAAEPAAPQPFLVIEDWCIPTIPSELAGQYHGAYVHPDDGERSIGLSIEHDEASEVWSISLDTASECGGDNVGCNLHIASQQMATAVTIGDGSLTFEVEACEFGSEQDMVPVIEADCAEGTPFTLRFELQSDKEGLWGNVAMVLEGGDTLSAGTASVERESTDD